MKLYLVLTLMLMLFLHAVAQVHSFERLKQELNTYELNQVDKVILDEVQINIA